jgi:UDP-N-acetylmuramoyl-L-alanyl-D-glutamate--2,6-diaminopimelate ligase
MIGASWQPKHRSLASLVDGWLCAPESIYVDDVTLDSRKVKENSLFLACRGRRTHGLESLPQAIAQGARAILWEPADDIVAPDTEVLQQQGVFVAAVPSLSQHAGSIAARFFDDPSRELKICAITGTNGKTTTAWLLARWFDALAMQGAYVGTLGAGRLADMLESTGLTTADAVQVQRQLAMLRAQGARHVAMEVSSHALDQQRVSAVKLQVAVFTNLSRDHLDYHGSMQAYADCKAKLFAWPNLRARILNVDDPLGRQLATRYAVRDDQDPDDQDVDHLAIMYVFARTVEGREFAHKLLRSSSAVRLLEAIDWQATAQGMRIELREVTRAEPTAELQDDSGLSRGPSHWLQVPLIGEFNVDNVLAAMGVLRALDISLVDAVSVAGALSAPPGRMEAQTADGKPLVLVDYAHTPDALRKALSAARAHCRGRLYVVFGCGGERDQGKRRLMGEVASQGADQIILTDDNPRGESPIAIIDDILQGIDSAGVASALIIHDRRSAIRKALSKAHADDVVLIAGKGHEDYQLVGSDRLPASDRLWVKEALSV